MFEVEGIPTFVLLDGVTGATINAKGRGAVGTDPDTQAKIDADVTAIAEKAKAAGAEELYFVAKSGSGAVPQVRKLCKLGDATATPQLILLDIPDQGGYYVSDATTVDADSIASFVAAYKAKSLERKQLG